MTIYGTDKSIIDWLSHTFGGSVYLGKSRKANWRPSYAWSADNVKELLVAVKPYLVSKWRQADLVLDFIATAMPARESRKRGLPKSTIERRKQIAGLLTMLNRRGNAIQIN